MLYVYAACSAAQQKRRDPDCKDHHAESTCTWIQLMNIFKRIQWLMPLLQTLQRLELQEVHVAYTTAEDTIHAVESSV